VVVENTVVGPAEGRERWRTWHIHGIFHPFEVNDLGAMVSIMTMLTAKGTREVHQEVFVVPPLAFVVIAPLGVLVPLILVAPNRLVPLGVVSPWSWVIIISGFPFLFGIIRLDGPDFSYSVVQNFEIAEWERDEKSITPTCGCPCGGAMGCGGPRNGKYGLVCDTDL
jgi:hypothetical protein